MRLILAFSILAAVLGGCAAPGGYGDRNDGYYRGYNNSGDGAYRNRDYNRGNAEYRDYSYRNDRRGPADPFQPHGS